MKKILLVEDEIITYMDVSSRLNDLGFEILDFSDNTERAIDQVLRQNPDLVLMDININGQHDGLFTAKIITEEMKIPVIFFTSHTDKDTLNKISEVSHYGIIKKPYDKEVLLEKINFCKDIEKINELYEHKKTSLMHKEIIQISKSLFSESNETIFHAYRISLLSKELAREMNLGKNFINKVGKAALFHDIGKQKVPKNVLNKKEKLTDQDWIEIKKHPIDGYKILSCIDDFRQFAEIVLHHHERWDGQGYPHGLKEEEIPLASRIIAIVDAYDVMTHDRIYKEKMSKDQALKEILRNKGKQFDPNIVDEFIKYINK
jgi:putative nucleotidyltransferase with HDIG domain